ncbi:unnamed protein product [Clonostachys rosea f. rosea IK726]|uniref:Ubiquitin-like protease family profile domain-containing protein n=2 Tax=Bionectria ochroleuca TaxID=29856 RepID=A0A0B7KG72_BIOOC|nr:unnamed protein product [Clonostachys rosea f. rosea IK726]
MNTLKRIGESIVRPINTLGRSRHTKPTDESSDKRQKTEAEPERLHKSPFFPPTPQQKIPSSVYSASQDDPYEIQSISSVGKSSTVAATVQEFRTTNTKSRNRSNRVRKRRQMSKEDLTTTGLKSPTSRSVYSDSPDVLSMAEIPPANVVSDVLGSQPNGKRSRPTGITEPPVKRPRISVDQEPIEVMSEDELQAPSKNNTLDSKKITTFMSFDGRKLVRTTKKGDIRSTKFQSLNSSGSKFHQEESAIHLRSAVSGTFTWEAKQNEVHRFFLSGSGNEKSFKFQLGEEKDELRWLQLNFEKLLRLRYAVPISRFAVVSRSVCPDQPANLYLEFEDAQSCERFIHQLPRKEIMIDKEEEDPLKPEKAFNHARKEADKKNASESNSSAIKSSRDRQHFVVEISAQSPRRRFLEEAKPVQREKLTDKLARSVKESNKTPNRSSAFGIESISPDETLSPAYRIRRRATRQSSPILPPEIFDRWTMKNPSWRETWTKSLVYPPTGKNRATVDADDIPRLDEGEFLNDNIITFYLRHLQIKLETESPSMLKKVHIFSSFFFETLKSAKKYEGVKSWTAKIDLFSYDYIVVPVNEHAHWYLAIICNPGMTLPAEKRPQINAPQKDNEFGEDSTRDSTQMPSVERGVESISLEDIAPLPPTAEIADETTDLSESALAAGKKKSRKSTSSISQKLDPSEPRIITLDSLGKAHSPTCRILKEYLGDEAKDKKGVELSASPPGMTGKGIPEQDNFCDCGVFVLGYMEAFLQDPDEAYRKLLHKERVDWNINPSNLRNQIRDLIFTLQEEQQEQINREKEAKRVAWREKKGSMAPIQSSRPNTQRASSQGPLVGQPASENSKLVSSPGLPPPLLLNGASNGPVRQQIASSPAKIERPETSGVEVTRHRFVKPLPNSSSDGLVESPSRRNSSASPTKIKQPKLSDLAKKAPLKFVSPLTDSSTDTMKGKNQPSVSPNGVSHNPQRIEQNGDLCKPGSQTLAEEPVQISVEASDGEEANSPSHERHRKRKKRKKNHGHESSHAGIKDVPEEDAAPEHPQYDGINRSTDPM